jgi:c-di-GMP-binding flagellar brake protein YcgR/outer membrane biosynthesis protein TonB
MPDSLPRIPPKGPLTTERRQNPRHPVRPTEYTEIGDSNGGIILDISEGGMAVASAHALVGNQTLLFRFQLPRTLETIEASGEISWIGETKKRAGVRFVDLPPAAREQIQKWIESQTSGLSNGDQKPQPSALSSPPSKIPQDLPRHEPVYQALAHQETTITSGHNPSNNLNPFSSALSSPLDEPEIDESEPADAEKTTADSDAQPPPERRAQNRFPMTASTYVQLSDGNGGLMANLSKAGFCVRAAKTLETDQLPVVRFQLPDARDFVESSAWIVWKSPSKKTAGVRFENLSDEAQSQIAQWIDSQTRPKNAAIKNAFPENRPSPDPPASSPASGPLDQRQKISPSPKTPAPVTAVPLTLMSPDSVPIPAYISPLAISLDAQPAVPRGNNASSMPSKQSPSPTSSAKPAAVTPGPPQSQKPAPLSKPLAPVASSSNPSNLASPAASVPRVASPLSPNLPSKPLPVDSFPDISRGLKNPWDHLAAAPTPTTPFVPATPLAPLIFDEPDWSVAPKRPTGYWKPAAMIVVIAGVLFGAATLLRSKKPAIPPSPETAENSSVATSVPAVNLSTDPAANSAVTNPAPTNSSTTSQPIPSSTSSASKSGSSREFYDTPRKTTPSESSPKGNEQFVDEPRPSHSQPEISNSPIDSNTPPSRAASDQPPSSEPTAVQSGADRNQNPPTEEGSGFPTVVHRVQTPPGPVFSNANGEAAPNPVASRNQQPDANLASAAGVTQNSLSTVRPATTSENNSSLRTATPPINQSPATATTSVPASSSAAIPNPVPSVSVFSRFRAIRTTSDSPRPAGSDLQIGRLKSGPAPPYPIEAQRQQIQGIVELEVLVGADGNILTVHLVKGPPELASVAMGAVRSWQYGQTTLGGHPVETDQSIYFTFKLTK